MTAFPPDPNQHPAVSLLKILADPAGPLNAAAAAEEHKEQARRHQVDNPAAIAPYPGLLQAAKEQAEIAAAMDPEAAWQQVLSRLQAADQAAGRAKGQLREFSDQDQAFLNAEWTSARRSLRYAQDQIRERRQLRPPWVSPPASSLLEVQEVFDRLSPFDQARFARALLERIAARGAKIPMESILNLHEAATAQVFAAAHADAEAAANPPAAGDTQAPARPSPDPPPAANDAAAAAAAKPEEKEKEKEEPEEIDPRRAALRRQLRRLAHQAGDRIYLQNAVLSYDAGLEREFPRLNWERLLTLYEESPNDWLYIIAGYMEMVTPQELEESAVGPPEDALPPRRRIGTAPDLFSGRLRPVYDRELTEEEKEAADPSA